LINIVLLAIVDLPVLAKNHLPAHFARKSSITVQIGSSTRERMRMRGRTMQFDISRKNMPKSAKNRLFPPEM